ncbi:MAG: ammonium transporter [Actinomycetota bacterium]
MRRNVRSLVVLGSMAMLLMIGGTGTARAQAACDGTAAVGDPCGDVTGSASDVFGGEAPSTLDGSGLQTVADQVGKNKIAINFTWILLTGFLVLFMQAGFAMVETGFTRAKNAAHTMSMNFMVFAVGVIGYFLAGFAIQFGGVGGIAALGGTPPLTGKACIGAWCFFGYKGFLLSSGGAYDVGVYAFFMFQMVFMDTAATIVTGSMAERWKWGAFIVYGFFMSIVLYPLFGMWAWGGGWLAALGTNVSLGHGYVDFAGSGVVHAVGGLCALAGAMVIGPRIGRYREDGTPNPMPGHNIPFAIAGTFILLFGWFGFNPGSTFAATDLRISVVAVNTVLASAFGAFACMLWCMRTKKLGKPDPAMMANGMLAGLVAVTAPSGFVSAWAACLIGAIAGVLVVESVAFWDRRRIDDPVGAISVHGICGLWGVIAVGLFADGTYGAGWNGVDGAVKGLFYGDASQLVAQLVGVATLLVWAFGLSYVFFKFQHRVQGIRVTAEEELAGLDIPLMGASAYPDYVLVDAAPETNGNGSRTVIVATEEDATV